MSSTPATSAELSVPVEMSEGYRNYLLGLLLCIQTLTYIDNRVMSLVLQQIKLEFVLSDTQLGVLTGIAFSLFYAVMGIPIARWADRGNRVTIISVTIGLWSIATSLVGAAASFLQLLVIRVCVAVGEAGCIPPAQSLIADYFSRAERPRAVARYMLAAPLSLVIGYFLAGWLSELYGWRTLFFIIGLPGVFLSVLAWLTLREPRLTSSRSDALPRADTEAATDDIADTSPTAPSLSSVLATLWKSHTFRNLLIFYSIVSFFGYGIGPFKPAFFARSFGMGTSELGTWLALTVGSAGFLGTYLGGELVSRYCGKDERRQLRLISLGYGMSGAISACIYLASSQCLAFALMTLAMFVGFSAIGPLFAVFQTIVPPHMRAQAIAIIYLFANLIGMGIGPIAVGALSDLFAPKFGQESLRYALMIMSLGYLWGAWHAWRASATVTEDMANAEAPAAAAPRVPASLT